MSTRFFTHHGEQTPFKNFQVAFESNADIERFSSRDLVRIIQGKA